jgi:class 3 adenylate cyclase
LLNSKELLQKTGISRATLNNYIGWGIVPRPEVLPPGPADGAAPRIGYFPDEIVDRIAEIQRFKSDGWSMKAIAEHFAARQSGAMTATPPTKQGGAAPASGQPIEQTARPPAASGQDKPAAGSAAVETSTGDAPATAGPEGTRLAELRHVAVLVADLQQPATVWSELPAEEYFELINQIWLTADPIFRRHQGVHGKHPADGLVCYFFPQGDSSYVWNALAAACELRQAMRRVSKQWQLRKAWATELYMNTGIDEGQQWMGTLKSPGRVESTMLGATLNRAARISDFARFGAIWASKNLIGKLTAAERQRLKFGVRRMNDTRREAFVPSIFSTVDTLTDAAAAPPGDKLKEIARLPITEIVEIVATEKRRERELGQDPS